MMYKIQRTPKSQYLYQPNPTQPQQAVCIVNSFHMNEFHNLCINLTYCSVINLYKTVFWNQNTIQPNKTTLTLRQFLPFLCD